MNQNRFDEAAATWDEEPHRIALAKAVGEAILREARPARDVDLLDYGCGTGLVGLYLLPHVRSVTAADSSPGMLKVLRKKLAEAEFDNMRAISLDLEREQVPSQRYGLLVTSMTLHHVADTDRLLRAFHELLHPGATLCIADLDTEPGSFHTPEAAPSVHHRGFDRNMLGSRLERLGFQQVRDVTAHIIRRAVPGGEEREFPVFLITADRP